MSREDSGGMYKLVEFQALHPPYMRIPIIIYSQIEGSSFVMDILISICLVINQIKP